MAVFKLKNINNKIVIGESGIITEPVADPEKIEYERLSEEKEKLIAHIAKLKKESENIISQAQKQAQEILDKAEQEKKSILNNLEDVKSECQKIREQSKKEVEKEAEDRYSKAYDEGFAKGVQDGEQEGLRSVRDEYSSILQEAERIANNVIEKKQQIISNSDKEILRIIILIAKKVINAELKINDEIVFNNIKAALSRLTDKANVTVHINKKDLNILEHRKEEFFNTIRGLKNFNIIEENFLKPGDCIVETDYGFIDAVIDSQFEELERQIMNEEA